MKCLRCGAEFARGVSFCRDCDHRYDEREREQHSRTAYSFTPCQCNPCRKRRGEPVAQQPWRGVV